MLGILYDRQRARGARHRAAMSQVSKRLVGTFDGCLKNRTLYHEATARRQHTERIPAAA